MTMRIPGGPSGHLQVRTDAATHTRSYWAYWRDHQNKRCGRRLGPAHVRDSGRRTARGAIIWRAGHGSRPGPEFLTPKDAEACLHEILTGLDKAIEQQESTSTLRSMMEGWVAERTAEKGLKRSTLAGYEDMFERLYRDLGAEAPVTDFLDGRLRGYFAVFNSYRVLGKQAAITAKAEGKDVRQVTIERWTAQPPRSTAIEVATKAEAVRLADELPGTWKHRRRGAYRVVPLSAARPRRVTLATATKLEAEGWTIALRTTRPWMLVAPAAPQTRNAYRDILAASFDYAVRQGWLAANPLAAVKRTSNRHERERVLRRADYYDPQEVHRLLEHAPGRFEEAFWLCGAHAGLRLPGEALGLRWGAVDLKTLVLRPYDNWVRGALDTTKTGGSEAIPMTPRLAQALTALKQRGHTVADQDFVFADPLTLDQPAAQDPLREAFKRARETAGLKPIKMYNLRHSFGTSLAANGIDVRTIQGLMRHKRLSTTEQYMAYAPRPELAEQITRALDPRSLL
jgi:integrase